MPVDEKLLEILCCPVTRASLKVFPENKIRKLNGQIRQNKVKYADHKLVKEPLTEGLITIDEQTVYRIDDYPRMLKELGIPTGQLSGF
ncbi:MAG: hypothetical protein B6244_11450 [Candidatus Cloacimonetes bacterium 4572_55]|nr:MAG: hypothetical protein B6244_11450 [Candidatus Cloacimonetes bacterium 4572_55]